MLEKQATNQLKPSSKLWKSIMKEDSEVVINVLAEMSSKDTFSIE